MSGSRKIDQNQNDDRSQILFRAIAVAHRSSQRVQALSLIVSAVIASLGIVARVSFAPAVPIIAVVGATWAGVYAVVLAPLAGRHLRTSAVLQEMLDVNLFGLPWNGVLVGDRLSADEVSQLSRRYHGDESRLHNYYLVAAVVPPYDVLFCLEQNLAWGSRVRRRYAQALLAVIAIWCVAVVVVGLVTGSTVADTLSAGLIPSLGLLLACLDIARAQMSSTENRERVLLIVRAAMEEAPPSTTIRETFARQVQDVLFLARRQQPRTPQWFFRLFHDNDMADFHYKMEALEERHGLDPLPGS